jgi:predicted RNA-binding Zn-ribbon protein involved in translation (DUF1610 family)
MGILDRILKWFRKDLSHEEPKLSVTFNMVGQDYQPPPKRPKRKLIQPDPLCPYCNSKLESFPKNNKKCPECGKTLIVRSSDKIKRIFTVVQADEYDEEKKERTRINELRSYLSAAGLDPHQLPLIHMKMEEETGRTIEYEDVVELLLEKTASEKRSSGDYDGAMWVYSALADFRYHEEKAYFSAFQETNRMRLLDYAKAGDVTHVEWSTVCKCDYCNEIAAKVWTLNYATKHLPWPSKKCTGTYPFYGRYLPYVPES